MPCGIYKLDFGKGLIYIGQSRNIGKRLKKHKENVNAGKASKKMQQAFNTYGMFVSEILCECLPEELDILEQEAIGIFNSYTVGLNSRKNGGVGQGLYGDQHPGSKFSNEQIVNVFNVLISDVDIGYQEIAVRTGTNKSLVSDIKNGRRHLWLKDIYPDTYPLLDTIDTYSDKNSAKRLGKVYPTLYSPVGEAHNITNVSAFSRQHGLHVGHLNEVLNGKAKTVKGWHL